MFGLGGVLQVGELVVTLLLELRHHLLKGEVVAVGVSGLLLTIPDIGCRAALAAFPFPMFPAEFLSARASMGMVSVIFFSVAALKLCVVSSLLDGEADFAGAVYIQDLNFNGLTLLQKI